VYRDVFERADGLFVVFRNENLLEVNLLVYVLPIISMLVTLIFVRKNVGFDAVPGFERLSGLMILLACSFGLALAIHKTRLFVGFFGSIDRLFLLAAGIFALLKWSCLHGGFGERMKPVKERPRFPDGVRGSRCVYAYQSTWVKKVMMLSRCGR
jgi:hypothetical protein